MYGRLQLSWRDRAHSTARVLEEARTAWPLVFAWSYVVVVVATDVSGLSVAVKVFGFDGLTADCDQTADFDSTPSPPEEQLISNRVSRVFGSMDAKEGTLRILCEPVARIGTRYVVSAVRQQQP